MKDRKYTIGIDPDLHDLSVGVWGPDGPEFATVLHLTRKTGLTRERAVERMAEQTPGFLLDLAEEYPEPEIVVMEGQSLKRRGAAQHRRPDDIVRLAQVAGQGLGALRMIYPTIATTFLMPDPETWKGSVPKHAMQARLYVQLGWGYDLVGTGKGKYARPANPPSTFSNVSKGQWKHVGDALLLAKWGYDKS